MQIRYHRIAIRWNVANSSIVYWNYMDYHRIATGWVSDSYRVQPVFSNASHHGVSNWLDLEYVVTHPPSSKRHPAKSINDLDFTDDIALLESSVSQAQAQLTKTAEAAAYLGLVISTPKTEYVTMNCNSQPELHDYGDLKRQKSLAWCAFWKLEQLWKRSHIPSCLILLASWYCSTCMALIHGWSLKVWKIKSHLRHLILQSFAEYKAHQPCLELHHPSIPRLTLCLWSTWLGTSSWNFLVTSSRCQKKSQQEDTLSTSHPLAKEDLMVDHILHSYVQRN